MAGGGTMRAVVFETCGGPEVLKVRADVPVPARGPDQVLVKVLAAGVNPVDCLVRKGFFGMGFLMPKLKIPGGDLAGVVQEGAGDFKAGEKVFALTHSFWPWFSTGTYAEFYVTNKEDLARMPANVKFEEAARIPLAGLTAYQLAKARGAHVIATTGSRNLDFVTKELGADEAIDYTQHSFDDVLKAKPVDVVIDTLGGTVEERSFRVLKKHGHYQRIASWYRRIANEKFVHSAHGCEDGLELPRVGSKLRVYCCLTQRCTAPEDCGLDSLGKMKPIVDHVLPLEQAADAHVYVERGHARGNVILLL